LFFLLLLSHLAAHLALELMETLNLIGRKNAAHLRANRSIDPNLVALRCCERFSSASNICFIVRLAHYGLIERLAGLPQMAPGGRKFIYVTSPNLLHSGSLLGREPDGLHQPLLQLLPLDLIRTQRPIASELWNTKGSIDAALPGGHRVVASNLC
jgi:hypothetical protein